MSKARPHIEIAITTALILVCCGPAFSQRSSPDKVELGSQAAKAGFRNEDEIAAKFNNWRGDEQARTWLAFMGHKPEGIESVTAVKPHGEKADIQVRVRSNGIEKIEGISIKLVSTSTGFNQIDKRWLRQYAAKWTMPDDVYASLRFFVGELKPTKPSRTAERMFLNELSAEQQTRIVEFFRAKKAEIVSDLLRGDGRFSAGWIMVALKTSAPRWVLRDIAFAIKYYSEGDVEITRQGNLKIGRITMQRKGGDGGRETAKMLQFKFNPALLFEGK